MKRKSPTYWRKKCVAWAKEQAKKRDNYTCQYCHKTKAQGWQMHGSHILPEGSYPLMSADPRNILCLCAEHHVAGMSAYMGNSREPSWHGDPLFFASWFNKKYPGLEKELREINDERKNHLINWEARWSEIRLLPKESVDERHEPTPSKPSDTAP